jgi:hypothetical protein
MSEQLNTNTRILRTTPEGFTVTSGAVCGSCGVRDLCKPTSSPSVCAVFSPLFVFRSPLIGFGNKAGDAFNTFRLGRNTHDRFKDKLGTIATLYEKRRGRTLGYARIVDVKVGVMEDMIAAHANTNHLSIGRGHHTPAAAMPFLRQVLNKNYHKMFKTADRTDLFSVIFMERCAAPGFNSAETVAA